MPHITEAYVSNADQAPANETTLLTKQGIPLVWPPVVQTKVTHGAKNVIHPEGGVLPSAGISSSTSASKQDKSGDSAPETESSRQSPAQTTESPSKQDQASSPAPSSTADSASGSTQETGPSQQSQSDSSVESASPQEAIQEPVLEPIPVSAQRAAGVAPEATVTIADQKAGTPPPLSAEEAERAARDLVQAAREAYEAKEFDLAERRLSDADALFPPIRSETEVAHAAVAAAKTQ